MAKYKDEHGTTKVGDFLRSIGKSNILKTAVNIVGKATGVPFLNTVNNLIQTDDTITKEQKEEALKRYQMDLEADVKEQQEITKRWQSDNQTQGWLPKNIRPASLAYLTIFTSLVIILDSSLKNFKVDEAWITLLKSLLLLAYTAYFSIRGYEKIKKVT